VDFKSWRKLADDPSMTITGSAGPSLLQSVLDAPSGRVETNVALLKKAQDLAKQQGAAMVQVIEQAGRACSKCTSPAPGTLDTYA
jgi:hypothetical protein